MWRFESTHIQSDSRYLDHLMEELERDSSLSRRADSLLDAVAHQEPLIAESFLTPQDPRYHAEGPFMRDHLRLMLLFLFALVDEKVHLVDIEELRRLKGYEGEIQELEDLMKEQVAFFEVFTLCHDVAKWATITFSSRSGTQGHVLGFNTPRLHCFDDAVHERAKKRAEYLGLYQRFSHDDFRGTQRETQAQFYVHYGIDVHYPGHERKIHSPVFHALLARLCQAHTLPDRDAAMLEDLISHHMEWGVDFQTRRPERIRRYTHIAHVRGYDADDFIDLAQACLLLDQVVGSLRLSAIGYWHEKHTFIHFLQSEHDFAPYRRAEKDMRRATDEKKRRHRIFREVGLDGVAMMDVLQMEPGPEFGLALRRVHAGILGQGDMPKFSEKINNEIEKRAGKFYQRMFGKGE